MVFQGLFNGCLVLCSHEDTKHTEGQAKEIPGGLFRIWSKTNLHVSNFKKGLGRLSEDEIKTVVV